ncbi:BTAD domain-containing putative transcriptional regulator [Dactylosporangium sp. NPDC048998]|uniref:AfsR/SARP family transcriptional regulator n=1 Tax=Dactylosporangium sp. NPDC048998 TaxID=3363976 RepID=UPI003722E885
MLEISLLGPTEARLSGRTVSLSPLERNVLAILALSRNAVVSTERIIELLWGDRHPAAPRSRVQGLVSGLRRKVGAALATRPPGYVLEASGATTDLDAMQALVRRARRATTAADTARELRAALDLWRGDPLDGVTAPGAEVERVRLAELRIGLYEELFEAELATDPRADLAGVADLVGEVSALLAANPLRERLAGQLMRALLRAGRQADALHVYEALRHRLAEELGSDPCAELRALHAAILRGEARSMGASMSTAPAPDAWLDAVAASAPAATAGSMASAAAVWLAHAPDVEPAQPPRSHTAWPPGLPSAPPGALRPPATLPASVGHFTGRDESLKALTDAVTRPADEPRVVLVSGLGGLGKTALVVKWAHGAAGDFPDGQIFVDLHGGALSPIGALGAVLTALGAGRDELPDGLDERTAQYRAHLNGRRVLIVADDAGSVEQLLPLVPPTAAGQLVVTSRLRLPALAAHHAVEVLPMDPLTAEATRELLERTSGRELRHHDPAAERLVRWCGGYPLAVRTAGLRLAARPGQSLEWFVDELADGAEPPFEGRSVPAALAPALDSARAALSPAAAHLFGRLGLQRGAAIAVDRSMAATDRAVRRVRQLLDELVAVNLLAESGPGGYRFHDLVLRYARECGAELVDRDAVDEWMRHRMRVGTAV